MGKSLGRKPPNKRERMHIPSLEEQTKQREEAMPFPARDSVMFGGDEAIDFGSIAQAFSSSAEEVGAAMKKLIASYGAALYVPPPVLPMPRKALPAFVIPPMPPLLLDPHFFMPETFHDCTLPTSNATTAFFTCPHCDMNWIKTGPEIFDWVRMGIREAVNTETPKSVFDEIGNFSDLENS